jgi:heme-degrading monooxygenase HmoA
MRRLGQLTVFGSQNWKNRRHWLKALSAAMGTICWSRLSRSAYAAERKADSSVQLHIYIEVKPSQGPQLEKLYHSHYIPAIQVQEGFLNASLLRHYNSDSKYEIDIAFKSEEHRAKWAQSEQHQETWPKIVEIGAKITAQGMDRLA